MFISGVVASLLHVQASLQSIVLRVRQSNGMLSRVDFVSKNTTIADLCRSVVAVSNSSQYNISIAGIEYSYLDLIHNLTMISETDLKNGDIVSIIRKEAFVTSSSSTPRHKKVAVSELLSRKSKTVTIADLEKRKKGLFSFKFPKSDPSKSLRVTYSIERILSRINMKGGVAMLLGIPSNNSVVGSNLPAKYDACAAVELEAGRALPTDLSTSLYSRSIEKVAKIASSLGLQVLGCCIRSEDGSYWSVKHVHSALQIQQQLVNNSCVDAMNNTFIVLRYE